MNDLKFISEKNLTKHVKETIRQYGDNLKSYDLKRFNNNLIDPIKLIFDKNVYRTSWKGIIENEIFRQRDKSNNNVIGYFHQNIFSYIDGCVVPKEGWDVIFTDNNGIDISGNTVSTVYVEMKNKHNTMNSASASKTFIKMQNQILTDDNSATFLVEAISKKTQNIKWEPKVDGKKMGHKLIRRVSLDKFYELVTGDKNAFYNLCMALPNIIQKVLNETEEVSTPEDKVFEELKVIADKKNISVELAVYLLGFESYNGFTDFEK